MTEKVKSPEEYLARLPNERKKALTTVRELVKSNVPSGFEETMAYNMISYTIPLETYPNTYNKQPLTLVSIANQKNHMALYINNIYSDETIREWFVNAYKSTGKKLDMGKSCVRFKNIDQLPLDVIAEAVSMTTVEEFIDMYERARKR